MSSIYIQRRAHSIIKNEGAAFSILAELWRNSKTFSNLTRFYTQKYQSAENFVNLNTVKFINETCVRITVKQPVFLTEQSIQTCLD